MAISVGTTALPMTAAIRQRVLRLGDDAVRQPEQRRDAAEGEPGRHEQRRVEALAGGERKARVIGKTPTNLVSILPPSRSRKPAGAATSAGNRHERAGANEVERRQQAERQRAQAAHQRVVLADGAGEHHAHHVRRQHGLAVRPGRKRAQAEQAQEQELRFEFGGRLPKRRKKRGVSQGRMAKATTLAAMNTSVR